MKAHNVQRYLENHAGTAPVVRLMLPLSAIWVLNQKYWENPPKWMVYNNGKPYEQMEDLVGFTPLFLGGNTHLELHD